MIVAPTRYLEQPRRPRPPVPRSGGHTVPAAVARDCEGYR
jgi:hypothetical protein